MTMPDTPTDEQLDDELQDILGGLDDAEVARLGGIAEETHQEGTA